MGLAEVISPESLVGPHGRWLTELMGRGVVSTADPVRLPPKNDVPLTALGGGTGFAGGAIPVEGGVVIGFERLNKVRQFDPLLWRVHGEAGATSSVSDGGGRRCREVGLPCYLPFAYTLTIDEKDPRALAQSQLPVGMTRIRSLHCGRWHR